VLRYPTRVFQPDTIVVSYDRQHRQPGSQPKAAPATVVGAAFTYPLDRFAPISDSQTRCPILKFNVPLMSIGTRICQCHSERADWLALRISPPSWLKSVLRPVGTKRTGRPGLRGAWRRPNWDMPIEPVRATHDRETCSMMIIG